MKFYIYWIVYHLHSWIKRDQLDITCFIISLFTAQHVSDVNISIIRSLRLICWVISLTQQISRKLLRMDVLTSETCWTVNNEIIKQVTSSWSLFIQLNEILFAESLLQDTENSLLAVWRNFIQKLCKLFGFSYHICYELRRITKEESPNWDADQCTSTRHTGKQLLD